MNPLGLCVCEVCGTQSADHAGWFAVTGAGKHLEILPWQEELRARTDCHHACCGEHLQKLIFATAARELAKPTLPLSVRNGGWNPATLVATDGKPARSNEEAILKVLSEIDAVLQGPTAEDEEDSPKFDA